MLGKSKVSKRVGRLAATYALGRETIVTTAMTFIAALSRLVACAIMRLSLLSR